VVEPGSTMKPFTMAAGLSSGKYTPTAPMIDTGNGHWYFMGKDIRDVESGGNGMLTPTGVLTKSSNIGAAKIALSLDTKFLYDTYRAFGYGESTSSGFPGESAGFLKPSRGWRPIEKATMGYGYGLNVTPLQLATAYGTLADNGIRHTPTFIRGGGDAGTQIISPQIARELVDMLETVTAPGGSATRAQIANYIVAGKTGTAHLASGGGYAKNNYNSLFAGIVPATDPRLVGVVVINNPKSSIYYGGLVSAPVFQRVMTGALRLLDVPPDNIGRWYAGGPLQAGGGLAGAAPAATPAQNTQQDDQSAAEAVDP
jgi:cell division protein FtsI (penicillin-binding protein 3)